MTPMATKGMCLIQVGSLLRNYAKKAWRYLVPCRYGGRGVFFGVGETSLDEAMRLSTKLLSDIAELVCPRQFARGKQRSALVLRNGSGIEMDFAEIIGLDRTGRFTGQKRAVETRCAVDDGSAASKIMAVVLVVSIELHGVSHVRGISVLRPEGAMPAKSEDCAVSGRYSL